MMRLIRMGARAGLLAVRSMISGAPAAVIRAVMTLGVIAAFSTSAAAQLVPVPAASERCEVPAYLLTTESRLDHVAAAVKGGRLNILVIGSMSSSLPGTDNASRSYPARLEIALRNRLPGVTVDVVVKVMPKRVAADVVREFAGFAGEYKPVLTIWQTGTVDAIRMVDADVFYDAMDQGVSVLEQAGSEVLLVNPQYSPRLATVMSLTSYLDIMRAVAQQHDVPLFDRFAVMRHWSDTDQFDLASVAKGIEIASRVHDCIGRALASFVIDAARIKTTGLSPAK